MDISFVILTWNSEKYISQCLNSLFDDLDKSGLSYEIFIVDNGSIDSTPEIINKLEQSNYGVIHPIFLKKNLGTTRSRNIALKKATGKYIVIMDSDTELLPGLVDGLIEILEKNHDVGIVVPLLVYPDGRYQKSIDIFPTIFRIG